MQPYQHSSNKADLTKSGSATLVYKLIYAQPAPKELERKFEEASESESVDTNTSERSTLRDCVRTGPQDEMDRSSNSTGQNISFIISRLSSLR